MLILETPSPLSVVMSARNFWVDPTHKRPVHPASLEVTFREAGFEPVHRIDLHPFPADERLPEIDVARLPEDPALHRAIIAYASDYTLLGTSALPHGLSWMRGELVGASLDHAIWFHRPARADEWLLYACDSPWAGRARGFNRGSIYAADGRLVASVAQEGLIRRIMPKDPAPD